MSDFYAGQDLCADVFDADTADAPEPVPVRDCDGSLVKLYANPADRRWQVRMWRWPNGDVRYVHSIEPRAAETGKITEVTPGRLSVVQDGALDGLRRSQTAANGNGSES